MWLFSPLKPHSKKSPTCNLFTTRLWRLVCQLDHQVPALKEYADQYQMMLVCPEGNNDWYLNSPEIDSLQWETYVAEEVPAYIDSHYSTKASREGRAITGLSMGGHGGLYLGLKTQ